MEEKEIIALCGLIINRIKELNEIRCKIHGRWGRSDRHGNRIYAGGAVKKGEQIA